MSDQHEPPYSYRLTTLNGLVIDFQSPNKLVGVWVCIKADGYFELRDDKGEVFQRIPYGAIASLGYLEQRQAAIYAPPASMARN